MAYELQQTDFSSLFVLLFNSTVWALLLFTSHLFISKTIAIIGKARKWKSRYLARIKQIWSFILVFIYLILLTANIHTAKLFNNFIIFILALSICLRTFIEDFIYGIYLLFSKRIRPGTRFTFLGKIGAIQELSLLGGVALLDTEESLYLTNRSFFSPEFQLISDETLGFLVDIKIALDNYNNLKVSDIEYAVFFSPYRIAKAATKIEQKIVASANTVQVRFYTWTATSILPAKKNIFTSIEQLYKTKK